VQNVLQDFRHALRMLFKSPGFAAAAILVLALGIGANTAIFSVVNAVLLRPLPFHDSGQLVQIWHTPPAKSFPGMKYFAVAPANYLDWERDNHVFDKMALYNGASYTLTGNGEPESINGRKVSSGFFSVLQAEPLLGRFFSLEEDQPGHNRVAVLNESFWKAHLGSDPNIVGKTLTLDGQAYTIIGVAASKFQYPIISESDTPISLWTPLALTDKDRVVRSEHHYSTIARLKPGVTLQQAQAEMNTISKRLEQQYPGDDNGWGAAVLPMREEIVGDVRPSLLVLLGAVALVLLIACANVANLVLARTLSRNKEIAIRSALGASRTRLLQQIVSETVLLSLIGGLFGLVVAHFGIRLIVHFLASTLPQLAQIRLDASVLAFTLLVSVLTGLVAGIVPALRSTNTDLNQALKQGLSRTGSDSGGSRTRKALVISEVALSLMLLIGAGLMIRSLWFLQQVDTGFDRHKLLTLSVGVTSTQFPQPTQEMSFFNDVLRRVRALPGVESAGAVDDLPLSGGSHQPIAVEGQPVQSLSDQPEVGVRVVTSGYLQTMRIPLLRGRLISDSDSADSTGAIVISDSLAKRFWPNEDATGKRLTMSFFPDRKREVVGVVGDIKLESLNESEPSPTLYVPMSQLSAPSFGAWRSFPLSVVVRTQRSPDALISEIRNAVHELSPETPVLNAHTMEDLADESLGQQRFTMMLLGCFAGLALFLAAIGIYSVLAYNVRRRGREIGIRMALGAQVSDVLRLVVIDAMQPTFIGLAIGIVGALALGRVLSNLIYGVSATDPMTFVVVSLILAGVAIVASLLPAYRAVRVEPVKTLRDE
jgi:putative ABC transport system permease protein